jgi:hypothetical protein
MDELLTHFPQGYNKDAAKHQCCYYLNDKPQVAAKLMSAIDNDKSNFK